MRFIMSLTTLIFIGLTLSICACGESSTSAADSDTTDSASIADNTILNDESVNDTADSAVAVDEDTATPDEDTAVAPVITEKAAFETTMGTIVVGFYGNDMPKTTANLVSYINEGFFNGLIFHRIVPGFVIQGGGFSPYMTEKATHDPIDFERTTKIKHVKYAISMARSENIDSATTQFFITLAPQPHLDYESDDDFTNTQKYPCAVFGIVLEGADVVEAIAKVETKTIGQYEGVPVTPVVINSASLIN